METEVKRGRGRPKKVLSEEELNKPKRPRGRPKKEITEVKPKRPRGRPKKEKVETNLPKRPRGRPRKEIRNKDLVAQEKETLNIQNDLLEKKDEDLQKGESYLKLKQKVNDILDSHVLEPLVPAKHMQQNMLEKTVKAPIVAQAPLQNKLNISRSRTPQSFAPKPLKKSFEKAKAQPNKVIVITGATSGMGFAMAKNLAGLGNIVIGVGRKPGLCRDAREEILDAYPKAQIHYLIADLSLLSQVKILADEIATKVASLGRECVDVLIHNAAVDNEVSKITYENREYMWTTNYLSAVLLTKLLQPMLDCAHDARIITFTTSKSAYKTKLNWKALNNKAQLKPKKIYNQTKLADLMFALEYEHQNAERNDLHAYCIDPGNVNTTLRTKNASGLRKLFFKIWHKKGKTVEQGIETAVYITLAEKLPNNVVFYANKKPRDPSKFALDETNRLALWRFTERELES